MVEFANGDILSGFFVDGRREGEFRVETYRKKLRLIIGHYERDALNGRARVTYKDDTWMEGFFKDGVLHGFARWFDAQGRLNFVGNYRDGRPRGVCWKVIKGGGCVIGRVDEEGELTGCRVAYLYPDFRTAFVGTFSDGIMEQAQVRLVNGFSTSPTQHTMHLGRDSNPEEVFRKRCSSQFELDDVRFLSLADAVIGGAARVSLTHVLG